ncbi:hypothetical protein CHOTACABRAS_158 [Bacillus phage Chotacabras]|nr:hypothetical protein CHOTACABRAS_158 [Bacillus phage Chotacabras]
MSYVRNENDTGIVIEVDDFEKESITVADIKRAIDGFPDSHEVSVFVDFKKSSAVKIACSNRETQQLFLMSVTEDWLEENYNKNN